MKNVAIIGAGASGLSCAIEIKSANKAINVTVFERLQKQAKKILATGNGRCNFTNKDLSLKHFYGNEDFLKSILNSDFSNIEGFFYNLGVLTYEEKGRIYPRSQQAASIRESLLEKCNELGVNFTLNTEITEIKKAKNGFLVNGMFFDAVIVAGGGKSASSQGSNGSCYKLLEEFGHNISPLTPGLCGLPFKDKHLSYLKGVRSKSKVSLFNGNKLLFSESGEVQFTDKTISGIPVMNSSHFVNSNDSYTISLDFCEEMSLEKINDFLDFQNKSHKNKTLENSLKGLVNSKIAHLIVKKSGFSEDSKLRSLNETSIKNICKLLKNFKITVSTQNDFEKSQITCGGLLSNEIDFKSLMSKKTDGLFICGELLNIHGDCGGYNLHLAFTTGRIAGNSVAKFLK